MFRKSLIDDAYPFLVQNYRDMPSKRIQDHAGVQDFIQVVKLACKALDKPHDSLNNLRAKWQQLQELRNRLAESLGVVRAQSEKCWKGVASEKRFEAVSDPSFMRRLDSLQPRSRQECLRISANHAPFKVTDEYINREIEDIFKKPNSSRYKDLKACYADAFCGRSREKEPTDYFRTMACIWLKNHFDTPESQREFMETKGIPFEEYINRMREAGTWADDLVVWALTQVFQCNIVIWSADEQILYRFLYEPPPDSKLGAEVDVVDTFNIVWVNADGDPNGPRNHFEPLISKGLAALCKARLRLLDGPTPRKVALICSSLLNDTMHSCWLLCSKTENKSKPKEKRPPPLPQRPLMLVMDGDALLAWTLSHKFVERGLCEDRYISLAPLAFLLLKISRVICDDYGHKIGHVKAFRSQLKELGYLRTLNA
eukprot:g41507.t1